MSNVTIDLSIDIPNFTMPDGAGGETTFNLVKGLNEVPQPVADHWYVKKYLVPLPRVPRIRMAMRSQPLSPAAIAAMAAALPVADPVENSEPVASGDEQPASDPEPKA